MDIVIERSPNWWHGDFSTLIYSSLPIDIGGMVTVQLLKDDEIVEEVKAHSFITPVVKDLLNSVQRFAIPFYTKGIYYTFDYVIFPFGFSTSSFRVYLKDSDAYPDPNDYHNRYYIGNTIGYATGDVYSGSGTLNDSDTLRGIINVAETSPTENGVKIVFYWPTHAANGIIKSIQFGQQNSEFILSIKVPKKSYSGLSFYNGRFYAYNHTDEAFGYLSRTGLWVSLFPIPSALTKEWSSVNGCCFDGQYWYVSYSGLDTTSTEYSNYLVKLDTAGNIVFSTKLPIAIYSQIAYSNGVLAVTPILSDVVYEVNPNTGQLTGRTIKLPPLGLCLASWSNNGFLAYTSGGFYEDMWFIPFDFSGYTPIHYSGDARWDFEYGTVDDNNMLVGLVEPAFGPSFGAYELLYYWLGPIFSRVILPQAITKTDANTLKVIYEFNYY